MKLEIEIDLEAMVREAIRDYIKENLVIHNTSQGIKIGETIPKVSVGKPPVDEEDSTPSPNPNNVDWEFAAKPGRRRSKDELALHALEVKLGRRLTPEEKGEGKATVELEQTAEEKAKEAALKKARIDELAKEGMEAASKELAEETETKSEDKEAEIPKADDLNTLEAMFK